MQNVDLSSLTPQQQRVLLTQLLKKKQSQTVASFPMSAGQRGLWHAFRRNPQSTAFNVFLPTRFRGPLRPELLQQLMQLVVSRHACLRTTFSDADGQFIQTVHEQLPPEFNQKMALGANIESVRAQIMQETLRPFDLERGPLMRLTAYQLAADDWVVLALTHHIVVDFWSLVIILDELRQAYPQMAAGRAPELPPATDNYREFVLEQQKLLGHAEGDRLARYWQDTLAGTPPILELSTDRIRPTVFTNRADCVSIPIEPWLSRRVMLFASEQRATSFAVVHAALQVLLSRASRQESFLIGSPFSGRSNQKYEQTVGFFINMLPFKANVDPKQTFEGLVRSTTIQLFDTLEHEQLPISEIVRRESIPRDPSRSPLFQVSLTFEKSHKREELGRAGFLFPDQVKSIDFAGLRQESFYVPHPTCHYDLEFVFEQEDNGLSGMLIYCRDLFTAESMQQWVANFVSLLGSLLANSKMSIEEVAWDEPKASGGQSRESKSQIANCKLQISECESQTPDFKSVHDSIVDCARRNPDAVALQWHEGQWSYRELLREAQRLSEQLKRTRVGPDTVIPVSCRNGHNAFVAMLAVHLASAAVIPIDSTQPSVDIAKIIAELAPPCLLTDENNQLTLSPTTLPPHPPSLPLSSRSNRPLAYMIYTSGSTGTPKGVLVEHSAIANTLNWRSRNLELSTEDRVLMLLSHQFDAALGIGWSTLAQGAAIVWPDLSAKHDPTLLLEQMIRDRITVLPIVPSQLKILANHSLFSKCTSLREIWMGGEQVPADLPALIRNRLPVRIWNLYGPTEAAVETTAIDITDHPAHEKMTIGKPIDGMEVLVVDSLCRPVPAAIPGELAISGPGLARGYLGDEELTARRFVPHPSDPRRRMYLTGDLGRQKPNETFEFLGRTDHQVKLRGFRIELGEIESALQCDPQVRQAAVIVQDAETPNARLVAYVSPSADAPIDLERLRASWTQRLSHYKRPSVVVVLDSLPTTSSGKVDRNRLPTSQLPQEQDDRAAPPRNALEEWLANVWCEELGLVSVGIYHNFFEVGGSSLQAAMVTTKLSSDLGVHVPTALLFDLASVSQVARRLVELYPQVISDRFGEQAIKFYAEENSGAAGGALPTHPLLAPLKPTGEKLPIFMVHPPGGIVICYRELAMHLPPEQPLWAIRSRGLHGRERLPNSMAEMAAEYIDAIQSVQPAGPYTLGGWSLGGLVAYEMTKQLMARGETVRQLIFLDTTIQEGAADCVPIEDQVNAGLEYGIELTLEQLGELSPEEQLPLLRDHAKQLGILDEQSPPEVVARVLSDLQHLFHHHVNLSQSYRLEPLDVPLLLLRPTEVPFELNVTEDRGWRHLVSSVAVRFVPGHHHSMVQAPHAKTLAEVLAQNVG